jgi:hypothetical protein
MVAQHSGHVEVFDDEPVVGLDQLVGASVALVAATAAKAPFLRRRRTITVLSARSSAVV